MTRRRSGINVVLAIVASRASDKAAASSVLQSTRRADGKARLRGSTRVALELSGRWGQDAPAAAVVGNGAVVDAVLSRGEATSDAVLPIRELSNCSGLVAAGGETEAAA